MKRILCYGDSNTFGANPVDGTRLGARERWPGILQENMGKEFAIIEEGLCGRTSSFRDPINSWLCGKDYLLPCLKSHQPLDVVIIMLGTNDLQLVHAAEPHVIAMGVEELLKIACNPFNYEKGVPNILLVSPIIVGDISVNDYFNSLFGGKRASEKSKQLSPFYSDLAKKYNCGFLDASVHADPSPIDGLHLDFEGHKNMANAINFALKDFFHAQA